MRVLLRLGDPQLLETGFRNRFAEPHADRFGREQGLQERIEGGRILDHAEGGCELHLPRAFKAVKKRIEQCRQDLAGAIGTVVEHQDAVAVLHALVVRDGRRFHELVVEAGGVALVDRLSGRPRGLAPAIDHGVIGKRNAIPALVAIHGIEAPGDHREADREAGLEACFNVRNAVERAARRHVATVEEGVDRHRHAGAGNQVGEHDQVVLMRMHAARRGEAHQMAGAARTLQPGDEVGELPVRGERSVLDGTVDARQVGHRDATGAEIHVANLGIPHLALRQSDEGLRCVDQRLRAGLDQMVVVRFVRAEDGVVRAVGAVAPTIEDAQDGWPGGRGSGHQEGMPVRSRSSSTALNLLGQLSSRGSVLGFWSGTSMAQKTNSPRGSPSILMS